MFYDKNNPKIIEALEQFQKLCLLDNFIMNIAFKDNIPAVQHIIRVIMDKPDLIVQESHVQEFAGNHVGHSVVYDITAVDSKGKHYDIEMQNDIRRSQTRRSRYHSSMIDNGLLPKSEDYDSLPDSYVIFITRGDFLGYDLPICHIDKTVRENKAPYEDGQHIIYVDATKTSTETELGKLMHDLTTPNPEDIKDTQALRNALYLTKKRDEVKGMWLDNLCGDNREEYIWDNAVAETKMETARNMLLLNMPCETISKVTGLDVPTIQSITVQ